MSYRLGVDVGGTFTDLLLFDQRTKTLTLEKVPTTVDDQARGIADGLAKVVDRAGAKASEIAMFLHGTTVATNAVLEQKGVKTALVTTDGFRDVLHIMRQDRPKLYDFFQHRPEPLVPRHLRFEVPERILWTGEVHGPLDEESLIPIARRIRQQEVGAVAVCLLHSYANPLHEERIREVLRRECPGVHISLSSEVLPEIREYDRTSTTVINAYVLPIVSRYLGNLARRLRAMGMLRPVNVMQSNGGIMPSSVASQKSAATILSGPAAGVWGGVALARQAGLEDVITVDMGGTSFDICLARQGKPKISHGCQIAGHTLKTPMLDIHAIGAGGGSIAWIDQGGVLKVGPQSAGADPGPACYCRGGEEPTVTDANLVLGRLNPEFFLGGEMSIDVSISRKVVEEKLAGPLGMDSLEVAEGVIRVVNASMVKGIRFVSVEKGHDPRDFALVCFGGNGPLHAVELARELGIRQVMIPFAPGVNCAYGLLVADFRYDYATTYLRKLADVDLAEIDAAYGEVEASSRQTLLDDGIPPEDIVVSRTLDLRYVGQGHELDVPLDGGTITEASLAAAADRFNELHQQQYGFSSEGEATEIVNLRIGCLGMVSKPEIRQQPLKGTGAESALKGERDVYFRGRFLSTTVYDRELLEPGAQIEGPAVIEQKDSTTLLPPESLGRVDGYRNIIIQC